MEGRMRYRLGLDLGTNSIGWCMIRLDRQDQPCAVIRMGSRIFSDGRNPKDKSSLAVTRRLARQMRRRRDRLLKRKTRMLDALVRLGFWPSDAMARKSLERLNPYELRAKGIGEALRPEEFGRALFHLNQRRGFLSNRRTDRKDAESGLLKGAIRKLREELEGRTVGQWLAERHAKRESVRARLRGRTVKEKAYDLYIDRAMVAEEFERLWQVQAGFNRVFYSDAKRDELRDILLHQRSLLPVRPGRCTLIPDQERAARALPSAQRFRIYQELNNLRILSLTEELPLTLVQRDTLAGLLEQADLTFTKAIRALKLSGTTRFNLEDAKRDRLKCNAVSRALADPEHFGSRWHKFSLAEQDEIVQRLLDETSESRLVQWLTSAKGVDEVAAERVANVGLPEGFAMLSRDALARVLPELVHEVVTYDVAVRRAGFDSHSALSHAEQTGEVMLRLPYYGEALQRHVGFADPKARPEDPPAKRFGRIANPTVHIGLNELRKVLNALIERYGNPSEVIVEVARELKQGEEQRKRELDRQAERQRDNALFAEKIRSLPGMANRRVTRDDLQRMRLWTELNPQDAANRCCPYTGEHIGMARLFSAEVEIDHILPFSMTLDDSLNNKTVSLRRANRDKGNRTPADAFGASPPGYDYESIMQRAALVPPEKRKRFAPDGYQRWLREDKDFLARALNDTAYLSRVAKEYLSLICPHNNVRVIPGRLTALLRGKFGLNDILGVKGEKNRHDHRHHAVDAAVVGVTDQGLLQQFARASADARTQQLDKLVESMPLPWSTFRESVARSAAHVVVSHRPDHSHEGALHNDTAYGLRDSGDVAHYVMLDSFKSASDIARTRLADDSLKQRLLQQVADLSGKDLAGKLAAIKQETGVRRVRVVERLKLIALKSEETERHGRDADGGALAYKGYKGDSNYCIEIWRNDKGKWEGDVISTFEAHRIVRESGQRRLRHSRLAQNGRPLVMRLMNSDLVKAELKGQARVLQVCKIKSVGSLFLAAHQEANVRERDDAKDETLTYGSFTAGTLQKAKARQVTVSPSGELRDPGFAG